MQASTVRRHVANGLVLAIATATTLIGVLARGPVGAAPAAASAAGNPKSHTEVLHRALNPRRGAKVGVNHGY